MPNRIDYQSFMDGLPAHIALVDDKGTVLSVNAHWRQFAQDNGSTMRDDGIGLNYFLLAAPCWPGPMDECCDITGWAVAEGLGKVIDGKIPLFTTEYPCHGPNEQRWFRVNISPIPNANPPLFVISHENISELVSARTKTRDTYVEAIRSFGAALEQRDPYTSGHQGRVGELVDAIGQKLGLSETEREGLRLGALVHDIGKLAVPAEILTYPGKLDATRFAIIQEHAAVGKGILQKIDFPWPVVDMVHQHHERMDGSGYPQGLCGDAIIMEARILAVADVVEAISSHRPYRPALGPEAAIEELKRLSGKKYDSEVVQAFLDVFNEQPERISAIFKLRSN